MFEFLNIAFGFSMIINKLARNITVYGSTIIWFNKTNITRNFVRLIDKHFSPNHKLHKVFNKNKVKVSYTCTNNINEIYNHKAQLTHHQELTTAKRTNREADAVATAHSKKKRAILAPKMWSKF